jgi:hypothetical protein
MWKLLGNGFVEALICGNAQAKEREPLELGISFAAPLWMLKFWC